MTQIKAQDIFVRSCKSSFFLLAMFAGLTLNAFADWTEGEEVEVRPGEYITYLGEQDGWQLWAGADQYDLQCSAVKAVVGQLAPEPFSATYFSSETPFALIRYSDKQAEYDMPQTWQIFTRHRASVSNEYRIAGERFMRSFNTINQESIKEIDGKTVEFKKFGYEHPNIRVGSFVAEGQVDFTGAEAVTALTKSCVLERLADR